MVSFTFTMDEDKVTSEYNADVKFYPAMNAVMKFDATHSHTDAAMNHQASLTFTRAQSTKKFTWNSGSNSNMCETSFTYMVDGTDKVAFTHKVNRYSYVIAVCCEFSFFIFSTYQFAFALITSLVLADNMDHRLPEIVSRHDTEG